MDEQGRDGGEGDSLLPYGAWTEAALREVALRALDHAAREGLPGEHHFYLTFRTDRPDVEMPTRLRTQYPQEMTIVLQHQFWDLKVDREATRVRVGLSFGGIPAMLAIPFDALTGFVDPHVQFALRFADAARAETEPVPGPEPEPEEEDAEEAPQAPAEAPQVVSLDAFRRRTPKD